MSIWEAGRNASTPMFTIKPPLTTDFTLPLIRPSSLKNARNLVPVLPVGGFFLGEDDHAFIVLEALEQDVYFVAYFEVFDVFKFGDRI